jgi:hypothetical protein
MFFILNQWCGTTWLVQTAASDPSASINIQEMEKKHQLCLSAVVRRCFSFSAAKVRILTAASFLCYFDVAQHIV